MAKPKIRFKGYTDDWEQRKLGDVLVSLQNNTLSRADLSNEAGVAKNVHYGDVLIKFGEVLDVSKEQLPMISDESILTKYKTSFLQNGDVIIADTAEDTTVGKCSEIVGLNDEVVLSGLHTIPYRPVEKFAPKYLGYYLNSDAYHNQLLPLMQGIKVTSISKSAMQDTDIIYPKSKEEQTEIGNYFDALDHLITLHQRKNIYFYEKVTLVWEQRKLGEIAFSFEYGLNAAAKEYDGENKYIRITDIDNNTHEFLTYNLTSPDIDLTDAENYKLAEGDILLARTGASVGKSYIYRDSDGLVYYAGFLIRARIREEYDAEFVFQSTLTDKYNKYIAVTSQRSGQPGMNAQEYSEFEIRVPEKEEQTKIGTYFRILDHLITLHQCKCHLLHKLLHNDWEQRKFSEFVKNVAVRNKAGVELECYAVTNDRGFISQKEAHDAFGYMADADTTAYNIVPPSSFAYNPARINVGSIGYYTGIENVIVSSLYEVFQTADYVDDRFMWHWFKSDHFSKWIERLQEGSVRLYFYYDKLIQCEMKMPSLEEQKKMGAFFDQLDHLITLHHRKYIYILKSP